MSFDWQAFVERQGIEYATKGPSTAKNNIYIRCPFCGSSAEGRKMGISLDGKGWGCWRNQGHRGKNPTRLVQAVLGCSWREAAEITGARTNAPALVTLGDRVRAALGAQAPEQEKRLLKLPKEFRKLSGSGPHYNYMREDRGFSKAEVEELSADFDLHYCLGRGGHEWSWRLIVPVCDAFGDLATWTGRALGDARIRYRSLTNDPEGLRPGDPLALGPISDYFLDMRYIAKGGTFLVIVEGPFDCFRAYLEADAFGAKATCLFGKSMSPAQLDYLCEIRPRFDAVFLMLDPEAFGSGLRLTSMLRALDVTRYDLPGENDPGDMSNDQMRRIFADMADRALQNSD